MAETNPNPPELSAEDIERFWSKVDKNGPTVRPEIGPCWLWTAGLFDSGYGVFSIKGKALRAHRIAYLIHHGVSLGPLLGCHTCDNKRCVNPLHIFKGTQGDNFEDCERKGRRWNCKGDEHYARKTQGLKKGDRNGRAKLTVAQVQSIRREYAEGATQVGLGAKYGVVHSTIGAIVRGSHWSDA